MHVVAIREMPAGFETPAAALAPALGLAPAALIARLAAAGRGPVVVGTAAEAAAADALAAAVDAAGFRALRLGPADVESDAARFVARSPSFDGDRLVVVSRTGARLEVDLPAVHLILRGTMGGSTVETTTTRERKFSPGKAALTGGLMITKSVEKTTSQTVDTRQGFVHLYAPELPTVALREAELTYEDFGPLRQPGRAANFAALVGELRRRCTAAAFDDRLLARVGQARLLGPTLSPEQHLDVAVALLAAALG
jgi:hypothetical protein